MDDKGKPYYSMSVQNAGAAALAQYQTLLGEQGFRPAGRYPSQSRLYKMVDGACYYLDTEHAFDGGEDYMQLWFGQGEPEGGFAYTAPEPKKEVKLKDLLGL